MIVFLDTSVLVEHINGNSRLYLNLIGTNHELCLNGAVLSEFMFYYVGVIGEKSPLTLKEGKQIPEILSKHNATDFLKKLRYLPDQNTFLVEVPRLMQRYNLLPNDGIILATCKHYGISHLATLDSDFKTPCQLEGISIIDTTEAIS